MSQDKEKSLLVPPSSAAKVLTRVLGVGLLQADIMLAEVSQQNRDKIIELYLANDAEGIHKILELSEPKVAPVEPKKLKTK
jgi:hypothetical protein